MSSGIQVEKVAALTGHKDSIFALEKGANGSFFTSGADGLVVQWDRTNIEQGRVLVKIPNSVYALTFIEAINCLLVGQNNQGIHLVDLNTKKEIASSAFTSSTIFDIKVFNEKVLAACGDGSIVLLSLSDLSTIEKVKVSAASARTIAINRERKEIAVGYSDNFIRIFGLENLQLLYEFEAHKNSVFTLVYTPDHKFLLSGSRDAHLKIWDADGQYSLNQSIVAHMFAINHIAFSPDANYFATCSMDKSIKVWDAKEYKLLKVIDKARHAGHGTSVNKLFWFSSSELISCSDDRSISIWNLKTGV